MSSRECPVCRTTVPPGLHGIRLECSHWVHTKCLSKKDPDFEKCAACKGDVDLNVPMVDANEPTSFGKQKQRAQRGSFCLARMLLFVKSKRFASLTILISLGERARVGNIWGTRQHVKPGAKLFLILKRVEQADGSYGHFQWIPYASCTRDYPPKHLMTYRDESGRTCRSFVQYVGVCSENMEREPARGQIEMAMGMMGGAQQAYDAFGALPSITVQIGI